MDFEKEIETIKSEVKALKSKDNLLQWLVALSLTVNVASFFGIIAMLIETQ